VRTVDHITIRGSVARVLAAARDVERWPAFLPHYHWVRILERRGEGALVEMAAWRPFGLLRYPTWWVSEMDVPDAPEVRYRHVRGITRGMEVRWRVSGQDGAVDVEIVHEWDGPPWPLISWIAANVVIGPVFVHGIASRTLAGIKRHIEGST
jgi:ribosome-associated toxin RatA of RatAB toxin-antitoxin module